MSTTDASLREAAAALLGEIDDLIGESHGVYGLHLNGDPAPWDEIVEGGRFERLSSMEALRAALAQKAPGSWAGDPSTQDYASTAQQAPADLVLRITTAYEQGVGHATRAELSNPYSAGTPEHEAWDMGRQHVAQQAPAVAGATTAEASGPRIQSRTTCKGCPSLKTEHWTDYLENDETDSGTAATCLMNGKSISAYWHEGDATPDWCPAAAQQAPAAEPSGSLEELRDMLQAAVDRLVAAKTAAPAAEPSTVKDCLTVQPAAEPVAWAQLGLRNGHTYVRMHYEGHLYPPPLSVQKNLNLAPLYAAPQPPQPVAAEPVAPANKLEGGEGWESLAWELCADEHGEDACTELIWEGGPVPEPWGDRWLKYEGEAKRLIALVHKHVPAAQQAPAAESAPTITKLDPGFRWDGAAQQHVPNLLIEFTPVPANSPCDALGWQDRDALVRRLSSPATATQPPQAQPLKSDARKLCTCDGAGMGAGRACVVKAGGRLGDLWCCAEGAGAA